MKRLLWHDKLEQCRCVKVDGLGSVTGKITYCGNKGESGGGSCGCNGCSMMVQAGGADLATEWLIGVQQGPSELLRKARNMTSEIAHP